MCCTAYATQNCNIVRPIPQAWWYTIVKPMVHQKEHKDKVNDHHYALHKTKKALYFINSNLDMEVTTNIESIKL